MSKTPVQEYTEAIKKHQKAANRWDREVSRKMRADRELEIAYLKYSMTADVPYVTA
jgi:hypothetical protein